MRVKGKVTGRKTLYHVISGKGTPATFRGAFGSKADALAIARDYRLEHPSSPVGVFRSTRIKVFGARSLKRGRIIKS